MRCLMIVTKGDSSEKRHVEVGVNALVICGFAAVNIELCIVENIPVVNRSAATNSFENLYETFTLCNISA